MRRQRPPSLKISKFLREASTALKGKILGGSSAPSEAHIALFRKIYSSNGNHRPRPDSFAGG